MDAKLIVVGGDVKAAEIKLKLPVVIGRGRDTTLTLPHPLVSRRHCEIFEKNGHLVVRDMGSLNGTYVNNQRIDEAVLPTGELLTIGTVTFRAVYEPGANGAPTAGMPPTAQPVGNAASAPDPQPHDSTTESLTADDEESDAGDMIDADQADSDENDSDALEVEFVEGESDTRKSDAGVVEESAARPPETDAPETGPQETIAADESDDDLTAFLDQLK